MLLLLCHQCFCSISLLVNVCLILKIIRFSTYYSPTKFIVNKGIRNISCRCIRVEKPLCVTARLSPGFNIIVSSNDEMTDRNFPGLQDEICDLYALRRHFQSVWITLKGESITSSWQGSRSLSWLQFPIYLHCVWPGSHYFLQTVLVMLFVSKRSVNVLQILRNGSLFIPCVYLNFMWSVIEQSSQWK